jgi:hypothetical protein
MYHVLRAEQEKAKRPFRDHLLPMPRFVFSWTDHHRAACPRCGQALRLRRTHQRHIQSLTYGSFIAVERQGYCPADPGLPSTHSQQLARIAAPGAEYAYDVLAELGFQRFVHCRQYEEIQAHLSSHYGLEVPVSTLAYLARKFVAYFQLVHQQSITRLRAEMQTRGGFILQVDGTCEAGSSVLLVCMDSLSGQILESRKISSENHHEICQLLRDVRREWGLPLAIVHDLRRSLITATGEVFPSTPQFVCHYHLAADVGKDILNPHEDRLRRLVRKTRVRPKLRSLIRSLRASAVCRETGQHPIEVILDRNSPGKLAPPDAQAGVAHALASWILAYVQDGEGYGFPFTSPYLHFYDRILQVYQVLREQCPRRPERQRGSLAALHQLRQILEPVMTGELAGQLRAVIAQMRRDRIIFEQFRIALRICPHGGKKRRNDPGAPQALSARHHRTILKKLRDALRRKARSAPSSRRACGIVVRHLDKYWPYLFGHALKAKGRPIAVPRTNNVQESLFRIVKQQCRRLHGRGHLAHDLTTMLPGTPLVLNLRNAPYCQTVYGGMDAKKIAAVFSQVDPDVPARLLKTWRQQKLSTAIPAQFERLKDLPRRVSGFLSALFKKIPRRSQR